LTTEEKKVSKERKTLTGGSVQGGEAKTGDHKESRGLQRNVEAKRTTEPKILGLAASKSKKTSRLARVVCRRKAERPG